MNRKTDAQIYERLAELSRHNAEDQNAGDYYTARIEELHWVLSPGEPEPAKRGRPKGSRTRNRKPAPPIAEAAKETA